MRILAVTIGFFVLLAVGCGGGGENEQKSGEVNTTSALRCSINMEGIGYGLVKIPAHCGVVRIDGDSFITDQRVIHLSGSSFGPETDNCSDPSLTLAGSICLPIFPGGDVHWQNLSNGVSGDGSIGYYVIGFLDQDWYFLSTAAQGGSGWSTHNTFTDSKGIELAMGANIIQISVDIQNITGTDEITIIRIPDVTSPSVYNVEPEPDGIYYFRVLVFFDEQLDPDRVENTLQVIDSLGQPTTGMVVYDPLKLTLEWRPADTLSRGATYTARLSDIADLAGNKMIATYEWSFTVY